MSREVTETVSDSMSERDLQRVARIEMTIALDNYLKKKRAISMAMEHNSCSSAPSSSVCTVSTTSTTSTTVTTSTTNHSQSTSSEVTSKSVEGVVLQEPLKTYDEALSNVRLILLPHDRAWMRRPRCATATPARRRSSAC